MNDKAAYLRASRLREDYINQSRDNALNRYITPERSRLSSNQFNLNF